MRRPIPCYDIIGIILLGAICAIAAGCGNDNGAPEVNVTASFTTAPTTGTVITDFAFDASASTSSGGTREYRWDWENDGTWDTDWSASPTASHRYASEAGGKIDTVEVTLIVRAGSKSATATSTIYVDARHGTVLALLPVNTGIQHPSALGSDGTNLWLADWGSPGTARIYKIDPVTGDTLSSIPANTNYACGLAWDGTYLCVGSGELYRLNPTTGAVVSHFSLVYSAQPGGLAWDGTIFYFGSHMNNEGTQGDGLIHMYSSAGTHLGTFASPLGSTHPTSLAFDGVHLWATVEGGDSLFVLNPADGTVLRAVPLGGMTGRTAILQGYVWTMIILGNLAIARVVP